jgi:hypothetical protein
MESPRRKIGDMGSIVRYAHGIAPPGLEVGLARSIEFLGGQRHGIEKCLGINLDV